LEYRFSGWGEFREGYYQGGSVGESTACRRAGQGFARMLGKAMPEQGDTRLLSDPFGPK
jgi:hypothetical protein